MLQIPSGFRCAATSPDDSNPWLKVDLGRPVNIVSVNFTLASDAHDGAAVVPNIEVRMGNASGARDNALCEWVGRIQLVSRRQRNFVFDSCNGVGRDRLSFSLSLSTVVRLGRKTGEGLHFTWDKSVDSSLYLIQF